MAELNVERFALRKDGSLTLSLPQGTHDDVFWATALALYATVEMKPSNLMPSGSEDKGWGKHLTVNYFPNQVNAVCSVSGDLRIEEGSMEDYKALVEFHYRNVTAHPAPIKIFTLWRSDNELAGVIVYSYPPQVFG